MLAAPSGWLLVGVPTPVADFGHVVAVFRDVPFVLGSFVGHQLADGFGLVCQAGDAVNHVHHEFEAVQVVEHDHVEGRGRRPFFLVATHVQVAVVRAPVGQAVVSQG